MEHFGREKFNNGIRCHGDSNKLSARGPCLLCGLHMRDLKLARRLRQTRTIRRDERRQMKLWHSWQLRIPLWSSGRWSSLQPSARCYRKWWVANKNISFHQLVTWVTALSWLKRSAALSPGADVTWLGLLRLIGLKWRVRRSTIQEGNQDEKSKRWTVLGKESFKSINWLLALDRVRVGPQLGYDSLWGSPPFMETGGGSSKNLKH